MDADKHNKNVQAIWVLWRVPKKGWKSNRRRESKRTGEGSIGANYGWGQWFCKQLLSRPLLCQIKTILSPWLRQPPHRRVSKNPTCNSLSLSHLILLFSFNFIYIFNQLTHKIAYSNLSNHKSNCELSSFASF